MNNKFTYPMTVHYIEQLIPLTPSQKYLLECGVRVRRSTVLTRAQPTVIQDRIPFATELGKNGELEDIYRETCGCQYKLVMGSPKVIFHCRGGRNCKFFV